MSEAARVSVEAPSAQVWRVLADIEQWPSWSPSVVAVTPEGIGGQAAYRIEQPPLPHSLWTITDWRPGQGFTWQTQGASSLMTASYHLVASTEASEMQGSIAWVDLQWSGAMAWMARAAYGPVSITYADAHLTALRHMCEAGAQ